MAQLYPLLSQIEYRNRNGPCSSTLTNVFIISNNSKINGQDLSTLEEKILKEDSRPENYDLNPKETIQYLINWLEWEWNDKYLSPQNSKRSVFTASSAQVREKINSQSSGYWKKYENLLKPVRDLFPEYN